MVIIHVIAIPMSVLRKSSDSKLRSHNLEYGQKEKRAQLNVQNHMFSSKLLCDDKLNFDSMILSNRCIYLKLSCATLQN